MSVNSTSNVVVLLVELEKLVHPSGTEIREICLPSDIKCPNHAVQLSSGQYIVCQGGVYYVSGYANHSQHRVCLFDCDGKHVLSYGAACESATGRLNYPMHLTVDKRGFIFVAD